MVARSAWRSYPLRVTPPDFPLLERLLGAVAGMKAAGEQWLPWWTGWPRGGAAPFALPALPGQTRLLFRVADGDDDGQDEEGASAEALEDAPDVLVAWRPSEELSWTSAAPVLLIGAEGDVDVVAGSVEDLVHLLLGAGNLVLELPRNAAELRRIHDAVQGPGRRALERLREECGLAPVDLDALGARLAAARAVHGPDLAAAPLPPPARGLSRWEEVPSGDPQGPDFTRAFREGAALSVAVMLAHEGRIVRLEGRPASAEVVHAGSLHVPGGKVVVGDILAHDQLSPQPIEVPPGEHPVFVALARFPGGGARVAAALLLLDEAPPVRWEKSWAFTVDSGLVALTSSRALEVWREDEERHADRLQRAIRRAGTSWARLRLQGRGQREALDLVACSSGWGDGAYATWIGRDEAARAVAIVAGFGLLPADSPEGAPDPPAPPSTLLELGRLRVALEAAYHRVLQGEEPRELAACLAPDARLEGPVQARGAAAVLSALGKRPLGDEPITFNGMGDPDLAAGSLRLRFAPAARPTAERGWVRLVARGEQLHSISIALDPAPARAAPSAAGGHEEADPADRQLAEALGALAPKSPLRRALIHDLRRHVLALGRPLSDEQRRKARELLG